jgi:hypothetical protein
MRTSNYFTLSSSWTVAAGAEQEMKRGEGDGLNQMWSLSPPIDNNPLLRTKHLFRPERQMLVVREMIVRALGELGIGEGRQRLHPNAPFRKPKTAGRSWKQPICPSSKLVRYVRVAPGRSFFTIDAYSGLRPQGVLRDTHNTVQTHNFPPTRS